jgi:transposase, IS30 family
MSKCYSRLSYHQRAGIYYLLKQKLSLRAIAKQLSVSPSTISREISRNRSGKHYFPSTAQRKTRKRWCRRQRKIVLNTQSKGSEPF